MLIENFGQDYLIVHEFRSLRILVLAHSAIVYTKLKSILLLLYYCHYFDIIAIIIFERVRGIC